MTLIYLVGIVIVLIGCAAFATRPTPTKRKEFDINRYRIQAASDIRRVKKFSRDSVVSRRPEDSSAYTRSIEHSPSEYLLAFGIDSIPQVHHSSPSYGAPSYDSPSTSCDSSSSSYDSGSVCNSSSGSSSD